MEEELGRLFEETGFVQREERAAIPANVIREVVVNAVCHRDYSMSQQKISVYLFDNRVEVTSPGKLPNTLMVAKMLAGYSAPHADDEMQERAVRRSRREVSGHADVWARRNISR